MNDCAAPRHDLEPVAAAPHAHLCHPCRGRLRTALRRLPVLHAELGRHLDGNHPGGGGRGHGDGLPYSDPVSEIRSQITHDLTWWTRHVVAIRECDPPGVTVAATAGFLTGCLPWVIYRDWAGDLAGAITSDHGRAMAILDPWVTRRFPLPRATGKCPACHAGQLWVTVYASDGDKRRSNTECDTCGEIWLPEQWTRLGQQILRHMKAS